MGMTVLYKCDSCETEEAGTRHPDGWWTCAFTKDRGSKREDSGGLYCDVCMPDIDAEAKKAKDKMKEKRPRP